MKRAKLTIVLSLFLCVAFVFLGILILFQDRNIVLRFAFFVYFELMAVFTGSIAQEIWRDEQ